MLKRIFSPLMLTVAFIGAFVLPAEPIVAQEQQGDVTPPVQEGVVQQSMVIEATSDGEEGAMPRVQFYSSSMDGAPMMLGNLSMVGPSDTFIGQ